jgi:hypothetical protein
MFWFSRLMHDQVNPHTLDQAAPANHNSITGQRDDRLLTSRFV